MDLNITGEIGINNASLTLNGYDKADNGRDKDTFTTVTAKEVSFGHEAKLTVGHNASLELKGLYIENYSDKSVQQGAITVTDGGKLAITGDGYHGDGLEDDFVAVGNFTRV